MTEINLQTKIDFLQQIAECSNDEYTNYLGSLVAFYFHTRSVNEELTKILIQEIEEEYDYCSTNAKIIDKEVTKTYIQTSVEWSEH